MEYHYIYNSILGGIYLTADDDYLLSARFCGSEAEVKETNPVILKTIKQLDEYFNGTRKVFNLPINPQGTEFQKRVWRELIKIPFGETRSYKDTAAAIGNKNAYRAAGNANNKNPILIIIPCHRVTGSDKKLAGYAGGIDKQQKLLEFEKFISQNSAKQ